MNYSTFFKNHKLALFAAFAVGAICIAPQVIFQISLGSDYRGIYLMQIDNEIDYLGRIQEISDGHWTLGSLPFYEYKDAPPLMPPSILEITIAAISRLFKIPVASILILSKFFLPALLFLLIYSLIRQLTGNKEFLSNKVNAIAGGLLVVLGYDLIDYRSVFSYIRGLSAPASSLLWTRPNNPILGAILIFSFLLLILFLYKNENKNYGRIFLAGLIFALAIASYFFSWGIILSVIGVLVVISLLRRQYKFVKKLIFIVLIAFILAFPYLYNIFTAMGDSSYQWSSASTGLIFGHKPILNKFLIFSLFLFLVLTLFNKSVVKKDWWLFSLVLIISGFVAFNQQIITSRTIWPFHFVQYTIPLSITALFVIFYNVFRSTGGKLSYVQLSVIIFVIIVSFLFGIYTQTSAYSYAYPFYKERQKYSELFNWINRSTEKDCVILTEDRMEIFPSRAILAYTHCNIYLSGFSLFLMPFERIYGSYLMSLRLEGVKSGEVENYLNEHGVEAAVYLYGTEGLSYGASSPAFVAIKDKIVSDYKKFLKNDLKSELLRYKLDYIITSGGFSDEMKNLIKSLKLVYFSAEFNIYRFKE